MHLFFKMKEQKKIRMESATQFQEIYEEHHNPQTREKKKILDNRKKRRENIKNDLGM